MTLGPFRSSPPFKTAALGRNEQGAQINLTCSISFETALAIQAGAKPQCFELRLDAAPMLMLLTKTLGFDLAESPSDAACAAHSCDDLLKELIQMRLASHGWRASLSYPLYESCQADVRSRIARFAENPASGLALRYSFCARQDPYSRQEPEPLRSFAEIKSLLDGLCNPPAPQKCASKLLPKRGAALGLIDAAGGQFCFAPLLRSDFARLARKCPALLLLRQHEQHALIAARAPFAKLGAQRGSYAWNPFLNAASACGQKSFAKEFFPAFSFFVRDTDPARLAQGCEQTFGSVPGLDIIPPGPHSLSLAGESLQHRARLHFLDLEAQKEARRLKKACDNPGAAAAGDLDPKKPRSAL